MGGNRRNLREIRETEGTFSMNFGWRGGEGGFSRGVFV